MGKINLIWNFIVDVFMEMARVRADNMARNKHYY